MLQWFMKRKRHAFAGSFGYDAGYGAELIDLDIEAGFALARRSKVAAYRAGAAAAVWYAARIVAAMREDCGPCVQLAVAMAQRCGVCRSDLRAAIAGEPARMSAEASLGYRFAKALLVRSEELGDLREEVARRWGRRALAAISINIVATRTFPALRYALGHGQSCRSVEIGGDMIAPNRLAYA